MESKTIDTDHKENESATQAGLATQSSTGILDAATIIPRNLHDLRAALALAEDKLVQAEKKLEKVEDDVENCFSNQVGCLSHNTKI